MIRSILPAAVIRCALVFGLAGCAAGVQRAEYDSGRLWFRSPAFSFAVPPGWRDPRNEDWERFELNQRPLAWMNSEGRRQFAAVGAAEMERLPAVLISARGRWIDVQVDPNKGVRLPPGHELTSGERATVWSAISTALQQAAPPTDKPSLELIEMEIRQLGKHTVLWIVFRRQDRRGDATWSVIGIPSESHIVAIEHGALIADEEAAAVLKQIAETFEFGRARAPGR